MKEEVVVYSDRVKVGDEIRIAGVWFEVIGSQMSTYGSIQTNKEQFIRLRGPNSDPFGSGGDGIRIAYDRKWSVRREKVMTAEEAREKLAAINRLLATAVYHDESGFREKLRVIVNVNS